MRPKILIPLALAAVAFAALAVPLGGLMSLAQQPGIGEEIAARARNLTSIGFGVALLAVLGAWGLLHAAVLGPLTRLVHETFAVADAPQAQPMTAPPDALERLPRAIDALTRKLHAAQTETASAVRQATRKAEEQKSRLEAILLDLTEGVVVCNLDHRILLYNQAASRILGLRESLGLGRPLFGVLTSEPVLHALEQMNRSLPRPAAPPREGDAGQSGLAPATRHFVCATVDLGTLLEARLSLVREPDGELSGYVLSFADVGEQLENLALRDALLREVMVDWRRPLASLGAAAEMLYSADGVPVDERAPFEEIVRKEVESLNRRFVEASRRYDRIAAAPWPMADIHSLDLFSAARKHLADIDGIDLTLVGVPVWIHADSHSLLLAIEHIVRKLAQLTGGRQFDIEVVVGAQRANLELVWPGQAVPSATLESWLDEPLKGTIANRTVRQIVERHGSELWSKARGSGRASIRLPLQLAERQSKPDLVMRSAPRPEYYDFDLFTLSDKSPADTPLRQMRYVVFDTETTGLKPSEGDELVSIGAVRVINGRILTGETFERLIDPGRDIPEASIKIHGITPEMVKGKPPARIVLPQFKAYVADSVLVAYNIAFDMRFLTLKQDQAGVRFDNPVLDALLLSIFLFKDAPDHSLSGMAQRLGIEVSGRHTAVGDAMATAAVWVRLLDLLEAKGITTYGEAARISSRMMEERKLHLAF